MTGGGGRCQKRRKGMTGCRGTAETQKIDGICSGPNLGSEITEKPLDSPNITGLPPGISVEFDCYTQARKSLSFHSPFDSEESQAPPVSFSSAHTLPSGVSHLLSRQSDSRKRHKKSHLSSEKKSSAAGKPRRSSFWAETEEYFRELTVEDIDELEKVSGIGFSVDEKCFLIPSLDSRGNSHICYDAFNRKLASTSQKERLNLGNGVDWSTNANVEVKKMLVEEENEPSAMDVDGGERVESGLEHGEKGDGEKDSTSVNCVEWLLGSRCKIYLASERPSKKRKPERNAGFEKLLVPRPVEGIESVCHYCSYGDTSDTLNCLIRCGSCGMVVHQRCYGVGEDVNPSWLCSWCELKKGTSNERPCLLCPKSGGALKPVKKRGRVSENEGYEVEFAHLFCSQWMPEFHVENIRTMELIMNADVLKDTRKKLNCYLCKVKCGACVRCSNGSCRNSFHPICAREAGNRMEIWGKLGCDEVELHAFCSKHSEVQYEGDNQSTGDISLADKDINKLNNDILDGEDLQYKGLHSEPHPQIGDVVQPIDEDTVDGNDKGNIHSCNVPNPTGILKKLIDMGKVDTKDVALEVGVSPDSLKRMLNDNHIVPELQMKLLKWLKTHAHMGSLPRTLKLKIRPPVAPKAECAAEGASNETVEESGIQDAVPVKSVPPRRRTKSNLRIVKDGKSCSSKDKTDNETTAGSVELGRLGGENLNDASAESSNGIQKAMAFPERHHSDLLRNPLRSEDGMSRSLAQCLSEDSQDRESEHSEQLSTSLLLPINREATPRSYIHPVIYSMLMQSKNDVLGTTASYPSASVTDRGASQLQASSSSDPCCHNHAPDTASEDWISKCNGVNVDPLVKAENLGVLRLCPTDEVEGELIYYQQRIISNAVARKCMTDHMISKVARSIPQETDHAGKRKWDAVLVSQYLHELKEARKQGRKERRHKEAQAVLAAATAAAAASSRMSAIRKDTLEESACPEDLLKINVSDFRPGVNPQCNPRFKDSNSRSAVGRSSLDGNSALSQLSTNFSKDHPRICEICRRSETILNPILVCSSCKVAVHLDCYRSVTSTTGPWHCELCEDLFYSKVSGALSTNWEKPCLVAECALCGSTASAFRKSVNGQWVHAFCAEWLLESTYRRGQVNLIEGIENVLKGIDACTVCHCKHGVCLKCSYGHCQSTFHPTCARSAGFFMTVRTNGGKLQHKAYCEKHSLEQKAKANNQKHGTEEFKSLKQVRVELERLRLLCERIVKREKLKRELVLCSHDILASSRDSVLSALARHPFYQPEISSESATTSIKGYTDGCKSGSEKVQRSDDVTVDSTVAGKRRVKLPVSMDNDQKTDDSSTSQNLYSLQSRKGTAFSGKKIPQRLSVTSRNLSDERVKRKKPTETFEKEILMTSDQASMKNQRLPKGFVYIPVRCLSKEKEAVPDASSQEPVERNE